MELLFLPLDDNLGSQTSNIFVANLPPYVTEQSLGMFFARIGPVGSVCPFNTLIVYIY